jgi:flagellar protein FlaI
MTNAEKLIKKVRKKKKVKRKKIVKKVRRKKPVKKIKPKIKVSKIRRKVVESRLERQRSAIERIQDEIAEIKEALIPKRIKGKKLSLLEQRLIGIRETAEGVRGGLFSKVLDRLLKRRKAPEKPEPLVIKPIGPQERASFGEEVAPGTSKIQKIVVEKMEVPHADLEARISRGVELQEVSPEGIELPPTVPTEWTEVSVAGHKETYNLIPREPKEGEPVFAIADIRWDPEEKNLVYTLIEPPLSDSEKNTLKTLEQRLSERLSVDFSVVGGITSKRNYLRTHINSILSLFGVRLNEKQRAKLEYYVFRDFIGLGKIEPLLHDPDIEDISCDGIGIPLYIFHRDPRYGQLRSNVAFDNKDVLDSFVMKIAQRCGKGISVASPLLDGALPDGSRVQATLGSDIARRGSNFTIRKFTENPLTPIDLLNYGTVDIITLAYLWMVVEYGKSVLISGATATGKTSLLNSISLFIRPQLKIVSIEDTAELRLPHPNWIPEVARPGLGEKAYGAVEMFDLLKSALRQRPDYIIVGEVRGAEANVMFQGMATGHPALGTIHADEVQKVVNRLITPPISLSVALLENLDVVLILVLSKIKGKYVRRIAQVVEVKGVDITNNRIIPNLVFKWDPTRDIITSEKPSIILAKIAAFKGISDESIRGELLRRASVLDWMRKKNIIRFDKFAEVIARYYTEGDKLMAEIIAEQKGRSTKGIKGVGNVEASG